MEEDRKLTVRGSIECCCNERLMQSNSRFDVCSRRLMMFDGDRGMLTQTLKVQITLFFRVSNCEPIADAKQAASGFN